MSIDYKVIKNYELKDMYRAPLNAGTTSVAVIGFRGPTDSGEFVLEHHVVAFDKTVQLQVSLEELGTEIYALIFGVGNQYSGLVGELETKYKFQPKAFLDQLLSEIIKTGEPANMPYEV